MKGVYVLIISVNKNVSVRVGAQGVMKFEKGTYAYVGSAQNNLEKRIARHLGRVKKKFWHIDYLLDSPEVTIRKVLTKEVMKTEECRIADLLCRKGSPILSFGCSDCKCESHLVKVKSYEFLKERMQETVMGSA
jgi:Uri superfamily endonuclease